MTDFDPLEPLRELPLPEIPHATTARIRDEAHRQLSASSAKRSAWRTLSTAAVIVFCISHLGWTVAFVSRMHGH
jgi:hypothetical protein